MTQNNMLDWDQLSMKQRAAYIRNAVSRGVYNTEDIIQDYNEFRNGGPKETPIYEDLPRMLRKAGLNIKVTSGYRPVGAAGNAGNKSWHPRHGAVDIVPQGNTTFEDIENVLHNNPAIRQYMLSHNFGLIDESGRTAESRETMKRTGATGAHFHIGRDSKYADIYRQRVGALQPEGSNGKVVYFTNPFLSLEQPAPQVQPQGIVSPEEIIQNAAATAIKPTESAEDIQATVQLPEVEVIGHSPQLDPIKLLAQIQESASTPPVMESYQIPQIQNTVKDITQERNTFLQKDLEDRILAEERRKRLGYSYRDGSIQDDIEQMQFLRNMSANGGSLSDSDYYTIMERVAEENNGKWNELRAKEGVPPLSVEEEYLRILNDNAYDYRGYYNKYPASAANADTHWPDEFKTAFHPTFSVESKYSGQKSQYNPQGLYGGHWVGDTFVPAPWQFGIGGTLFKLGGPTDDNDPATKDWEHRREHPEVNPRYKRTQKDEEYWRERNARNAQAAEEFNRQAGIVMDTLSDIANSTPVTSEEYKEAVDSQRQEQLDKWEDYKKGINATVTAAELGLSGASLLGAYANWKNWANAASASRRAIANLLQKAQFPMQVAGTAIDGYQTYDANSRDNAFDTYYNGASGALGVAGSLGAADLFSPKVDRVLDVLGILQNSGDFLKFGYDAIDGFQHKDGGQLNTSLDTNSYGGGGDLLGGVRKGSTVDVDQCAQWSNGLLRDNGYLINGNAWNLGNVDTLFNGFEGLEKPEAYDRKMVEDYNHAAADSVYKNFDSKTLDTSRPYVVNMYYNDSPAQEEAFNDGKGVTGTHTGVLTYDEPSKSWLVTHNIHGRIHQEPFISLQSGKGKYGVTAVYEPRKSTLWNRAKGFFGFNNGGYLNL